MEGFVDSGALDTLIAITGASQAVGTRLLLETGGDLNAAANSFFNEGDAAVPLPQRDDLERNDWMEEDEPAIGIPVQSVAPFGPLHLPGTRWDSTDPSSTGVAGLRSLPFGGRGSYPRESHPPDVRNIPIDWHDEDDAPSYPQIAFSNPRVEDTPINVDSQQAHPNHHQQMMDDEVPSTASSVFRSGEEATGTRTFGGLTYPEEDSDPDINPNAPHIAEVPVMASDEGIDIEEEMLRAAIEASKREAVEASTRGSTDYSQEAMGGSNQADRFPPTRTTEEDDLARAVTLSLKTAEKEKALRERGGAPSEAIIIQDDEENTVSEAVRKLDNMRRRGVARDRSGMARGTSSNMGVPSSIRERDRKGSGSSAGPIISSPPEDVEEVEEQPLLRRRTSRRSIPSPTESGLGGAESRTRSQIARGPIGLRETPILPIASSVSSREEPGVATRGSQQNEDPFPSDEWGGISSEEHDEALMLEAALFGGLPERTGLGLPYQARRGIHDDMMDALVGEGANLMDPFNRRGYPQPLSPTVVAQRLIREQQDDEYLASLAADREKELKAIEEAEALRRKELEAAETAASLEKLRREEELKQKQEAEDLERQLALKKETLPEEPPAEDQGALTLVVRLPDGSRRGRRFHRSNKLQSLFDFIDIGGGVKPGTYRLVRQYPRVAFTDGEHGSSLEALGLTSKQEVLLLELI